jgi:Mn2+/Fe2+ NRAMP family transporter
MPPALVFLILLVNDRGVMGEQVSRRLGNSVAIAIVVFLCLAGLLFGVSIIFPHLIPV